MSSALLQAKTDIRHAHIKQLAGLNIRTPQDVSPEGLADDDVPPLAPDGLLTAILSWIHDNPAAIEAAKVARCTSTSPSIPNWDTVLFTFAESASMSLRKEDEVVKAHLAALAGDYDSAAAHLEASEELIHQVAKALNCTFIQLCDFADRTPDGLCLSSGAYAGLFISSDANKPFAGVTFKGATSLKDLFTSINFLPITPIRQDIAWGSQMHRGIYYNLFGDFTLPGKVQVPFDVMLEQLSRASNSNSKLHIAGHSLGGALGTLVYGEFLRRRETEPAIARFDLGDLYTFGAPRSCYAPFWEEVKERTQAGGGRYSFRIVNSQDPVALVPPTPINPQDFPFVHVGGAWKITPEGWEKMADEPPPAPPPSLGQFVNNSKDHDVRRYYASWQKTPHS